MMSEREREREFVIKFFDLFTSECTLHLNSAVPPICTLKTDGDTSTCKEVTTTRRNSALASPPTFDAEHL